MGRTGITFEEVKKAIIELQRKQKNPTVDAIRNILGTGSKSTIARYLREWKTQQGLSNDSDGRLPSDLLGIVNGLWEAMQNKAETQIENYREEIDNKTTQVQRQLTEARQLEASLRQTLHTLEKQLHQKHEETQQLAIKLMAETHDKIRYSERVSVLELRRQEQTEENHRLHQLLKHVQENLEHYQTETQKLKEEQSLRMEKQRHEYEQRLSQLLALNHLAGSEKAALQAQHDQLIKTHDLMVIEHKALADQWADLRHQHALIKIKEEKTQHDYDEINRQHQAQAAELLALKQTALGLQLDIKTKHEKITSLEEVLANANDKIETLRHDSQFLLQEKASLEGQLKQMRSMLLSDKARAVS